MTSCFRILAACLVTVGLASAATPLGGLAVGVSPDGATVVAAGDSRALYIIDPADLSVTERHWLGTTVVNLAFTADGAHLIIEDTDGKLQWYKTDDWTASGTTAEAEGVVYAPAAGLAVGQYRGDIVVIDLADGSTRSTIDLGDGFRAGSWGISPDGTQVAVWSSGEQTDDEPKKSRSDMPEGLDDLAEDEWKQKNDGKVATLRVYTVADGSVAREHTTWFTPPRSGAIAFVGDQLAAVGYSGPHGLIDAAGEVTLFELPHGYNYGFAYSPDQSAVVGGSLRSASLSTLGGGPGTEHDLDRIAGWPEYFESFAFAADGTIYAGTSAYRVVKMHADGSIASSAPVY